MSEDLKTMPDGSRLNGPLCPGYTRCPALRALVTVCDQIAEDDCVCEAPWMDALRAALAALKEQ